MTTATAPLHCPTKEFDKLLNGSNYKFISEDVLIYWQPREQDYVVAHIEDQPTYTKKDYYELPEGAPYQLINGKLIHTTAPTFDHQEICGTLFFLISLFLKKHPIGKTVFAPVDVEFNEKNVYQPDIVFISNSRKHIIRERIEGAPDLVVEVLSPGSKAKDLGEKMETYGRYNVLEYWVVDLSLIHI